MKKKIFVFIISLLFLFIFNSQEVLARSTYNNMNTNSNEKQQNIDYEFVEYIDFLEKVDKNEVSAIFFKDSDDFVLFTCVEFDEVEELKIEDLFKTSNPKYDSFRKELLEKGVKVLSYNDLNLILNSNSTNNQATTIAFIYSCAIGLLIAAIIGKRCSSSQIALNYSGSSKNSSITKENTSEKKFSDIAGLKEVKEDVKTLVDFIVNKEKYNNMGAKLPKGVILYGPPGTGKTLLAKAIAGEAGVPFISASGSDFIEMYVGVGPKRVRELFSNARRKAPCIVFIDEIDAICGKRNQNENSEDRKTINAFLTEMDGFKDCDNILVIGATNRIEDLDPAILRPGRFTNKYCVPLPDSIEDRLAIIDIYTKNKKILEDVDLNLLAKQTIGCSPADIESILNESAIIATKNGLIGIDKECLEEAYNKHIFKGHIKKDNYNRLKEELKLVAWHEAGHALAGVLLGEEVSKVTILSSTTGAGGATFTVPKKIGLYSIEDLKKQVIQLYAGRCAEYLYFNDWNKTTTGASNDIQKATDILKEMICTYGMNEKYGMINLDRIEKGNNEILLEQLSKESKILQEECIELLNNNKENLEKLVELLLEKETIYESDLDFIKKEKLA